MTFRGIEDGSDALKQERFSFHGPNRMIIETIANDSGMITTFEREGTQMQRLNTQIEIWNFQFIIGSISDEIQ